MKVEERLELILRNSAEVITPEELETLLHAKAHPTAYIGFEPSGFVHTGQLLCVDKIIELNRAGVGVTVLLADWHAYINDKLGGSLENIRACGAYLEECFRAVGVQPELTKFVYASDLVDDAAYWERFIRIGKSCSLLRVKRAMTIMGRTEEDADIDASKLMYPPMQVADIFALGVDIAYAGLDQRRAHMLARDVAEKLHWPKPIALHTPLISGLQGGVRMDPAEAKMSKSHPDNAIFLHDPEADIARKLERAFCPPQEEGNPVLEHARYLLFDGRGPLSVDRPAKYGGSASYGGYQELLGAYKSGELHAQDLKGAVSSALAARLRPVREQFERHPQRLEALKRLLITR